MEEYIKNSVMYKLEDFEEAKFGGLEQSCQLRNRISG